MNWTILREGGYIYIYIYFVCLCARVEDWSREKLTKLNTIKEVFVNGITCTTMARKKEKKKKKKSFAQQWPAC